MKPKGGCGIYKCRKQKGKVSGIAYSELCQAFHLL